MSKNTINKKIYETTLPLFRAGSYAFAFLAIYWVLFRALDFGITIALFSLFFFYLLFFFLRTAEFYQDHFIIKFPLRKWFLWNSNISIQNEDIDWIAVSNNQRRNTSINLLKLKIVFKKAAKTGIIARILYSNLYLEYAIGVKAFFVQMEKAGVVIEYNLKGPGAEDVEP